VAVVVDHTLSLRLHSSEWIGAPNLGEIGETEDYVILPDMLRRKLSPLHAPSFVVHEAEWGHCLICPLSVLLGY